MTLVKSTIVVLCLLFACGAFANEYNGEFPKAPSTTSADRVIVKWKASAGAVKSSGVRQQKIRQLSAKTNLQLQSKGRMGPTMDVLQLERRLSAQELADTLETLSSDPAIEFAAPDLRRHAHALPNDVLISDQWYFLSNEVAALRTEAAWDTTTGSDGTVVAVLDTGVRFDHPDLLPADEGGKLLPGYDFVAGSAGNDFLAANDGDGRDADASDPGDWVESSDLGEAGFEECELSSSSWHGTRVAAVIAAKTNNSAGVAGAGWSTWILPVRVLGKCGGFDSDILAAARWAAGLSVPGVPNNPDPAKIINLSLGGGRICTAAYRSVVSELAALGVLIVASAGNEGGPVSAPASCAGVLGVSGVRQVGTKVGFSNLGPGVGIAAPGGNCVNVGPGQPCLFSIITATNLGDTTPATSSYTDQFNFNVGTSFSAPLVSGAAALMHAVNARLGPQHLIARLQQGATPFPSNPDPQQIPTCHVPLNASDLQVSECYCTTNTCGAGIVNASGAVSQALRPAVAIQIPDAIAPGQDVTFDGAASAAACGRAIANYHWSVVESSSTPPPLSSTNEATTTVQAPPSGAFTIRLTITDDAGAEDSADVVVTSTGASTSAPPLVSGSSCPVSLDIANPAPPTPPPTPAPTPPPTTSPPATPPSSSGGGGGGGQFDWELLMLVLLAGRRKRMADR